MKSKGLPPAKFLSCSMRKASSVLSTRINY